MKRSPLKNPPPDPQRSEIVTPLGRTTGQCQDRGEPRQEQDLRRPRQGLRRRRQEVWQRRRLPRHQCVEVRFTADPA